MRAVSWVALALSLRLTWTYRPQEAHHLKVDNCGQGPGFDGWTEWEAITYLTSFWPDENRTELTSASQGCPPEEGIRIPLGNGFDVTCQGGSVASIGIQVKSATARLHHLSCALSKLSGVNALYLDDSNITGNMIDLESSQLQRLERLQMRQCNVDVDLSQLSSYTFVALKLSGKRVHGSLRDVNWEKLKFLDLRDTNVTGDVSSDTVTSSSLQGLWLQNTRVEGDIQVLIERNKNLWYLDAANTKITGSINDAWKYEGQYLRELNINGTSITFHVTEPSAHDSPKPFPKLRILEISYCPLNITVKDFLLPLRHNDMLAIVAATHCQLRGELMGTRVYQHFPLRELRLSHNDITGLEGRPLQFFLDVSHNPLKGIDTRYFQEPLVLDIRSTGYSMPEDLFNNTWQQMTKSATRSSKAWRCHGPQPLGDQTRVSLDPEVFAPSVLCRCNAGSGRGINCSNCPNGMVPAKDDMFSCSCPRGQAWLPIGSDEVDSSDGKMGSCFVCPDNLESDICRSTSTGTDCTYGYTGTLCTSCSDGFRSVGYASCKSCGEREMKRGLMLAAVGFSVLVALCVMLWYFVWRPPEKSAVEQGHRVQEMMEQGLLLLNHVQILVALKSIESINTRRSIFHEILQLRAEFLMQLLPVQCLAGHQRGREIEILASIYCLPVLWVLGLAVATCRGSPFLALKFGIAVTSVLLIGTMQVAFTNLSWCMDEVGNKKLAGNAFLHERPFQRCTDTDPDPLAPALLVSVGINAGLIPTCLALTGWYISRRMQRVHSLAGCIVPGRFTANHVDHIELTLWEGVSDASTASQDLGKYEHLPKAALCIYAASHAAHLSELMGASTVEVTQAQSHLKIHVPVSESWSTLAPKYQQSCLAMIRKEADMIGRNLLFRSMAKHVLQEGPLWLATRSSFERFADKDPLLCEGMQRIVLLGFAQLCFKGRAEHFSWTALFLFFFGWGIFFGKPYGSRSRNNLAAICYISLSLFTFSMWVTPYMEDTVAAVISIAGYAAAVFPLLYGLHLHLMPGDIALQVYAFLPAVEKLVSGTPKTETQKLMLPPIRWQLEQHLSCVHGLLTCYRECILLLQTQQMQADSQAELLAGKQLSGIRRWM
ncbi:unnamed protein product [Symbiodinium sp. CCMP2456]|nr:unnamed protein product [Symbiodinium sp. CCMP2456]